MKWSLLLLSDLHFEKQEDGQIKMRNKERFDIEKLKHLQQEKNLKLIISAGDLTDHGYGGNTCFNRQEDELQPFIDEFVVPIEAIGLNLLLCGGNHDTYVKWPYICKPVLKYIKKKYNTTYSIINHNNSNCYKREFMNITFISMGIYPKNLSWLKKNLPNDKYKPIIIFFHYNIIETEPFSNWWKSSEKDKFFKTIKEHNIIALFHGHYHDTYKKTWNHIPIFNGSSATGGLLLEFEDTHIINQS